MNTVYEKVAWHIFNWPHRETCLAEWKRIYGTAPFYFAGVSKINEFFDLVVEGLRLTNK